MNWINQTEMPVNPHSEIIAVIGTTKYMAYVGGDKTIWPLGLADFKPFPSSNIEKYLIIPSTSESPSLSSEEEAIGFAEWMGENVEGQYYINDESIWEMNGHKLMNSSELYNLYKQQDK